MNGLFSPLRLAACLALLIASSARAVQIQDVVRLKGSETSKITGMGLVIGLNGTGDGNKLPSTMRGLAEATRKLLDPAAGVNDFKDVKNVAVVTLSAEIPASGVREGDQIDVHVAAVAAKSLEGGRLFLVPLISPNLRDTKPVVMAEGNITVLDKHYPQVGVIKSGGQLVRDISTQLLDPFGRMTLVINNDQASWPVANAIASLVNGLMSPDGPPIAKAFNQKNVVIEVPPQERADPAAFVSQILQSYIDESLISTPAKVVINEKTGTIAVTGDVQISPVIISHKGLTITTITPESPPTLSNPRTDTSNVVAIDPQKRGNGHLVDLLNAFKQLKVEPADQIDILRLIHKAGKIHAQIVEE